MNRALCSLAAALVAGGVQSALAQDGKVIVHEWGTFTCLQDEQGKAIGGINVDDEPVPDFVNGIWDARVAPQYGPFLGGQPSNLGLPPYESGKSWVTGDPAVTMRLETPVIYLYPPKGEKMEDLSPLSVEVEFNGGVLSQFYPIAEVTGLPLKAGYPHLNGTLNGKVTAGLLWKDVRLGGDGKARPSDDRFLKDAPIWRGALPETTNPVWTTPREVNAPILEVKGSLLWGDQKPHDVVESEKFLFYRGVGHVDSPVIIGNGIMEDHLDRSAYLPAKYGPLGPSWLVEIREDGACAFTKGPEVAVSGAHEMAVYEGIFPHFKDHQFQPGNLDWLKSAMQTELVKAGLYPEEASAMLRTWELSYFKSPGLRFFYIVPKPWVEETLPLKVTGEDVDITRVMVGRIELVTPEQRAILARLAAGPCPDLSAVKVAAANALVEKSFSLQDREAFATGNKPLADLGIPIPPLIRDYLALGRFRDALIVHEQHLHPSPALAKFIADNKLVPEPAQ